MFIYIYINFSFDFLGLDKRWCFKLLRQRTHQMGRFKPFKTLTVRALSDMKPLELRSRVLYLIKHSCSCFK
jgi:hypothetical protein